MSSEPKVGQPSKYKPEYAQQLLEYFGENPYKEVAKKIHTKSGDVIEINEDQATDFKSLAGFATIIGVHRDTLHSWATSEDSEGNLKHPEFSDAYKRAKDFQEHYLLVNGNKGLINPAFGIFTAKNVIGYRDRQKDEVDVIVNNNNSNGSQISDEDLESKINEKLEKLKAKGD